MRRLLMILLPSALLGSFGCMHAHGDDAASLAQEPPEDRREHIADLRQFWGSPPPLSLLNNETWPGDAKAPATVQQVGATVPATTPGGSH